jgi:pyruvate/2-oxoglutarate dehydrogenase complex dihydrolipoamide acyltransferase (E2) component
MESGRERGCLAPERPAQNMVNRISPGPPDGPQGDGEPRRPIHAPLSRIQRLIGTRMLASKRRKPCFYLATRADVTDLLAMRHQLSKSLGVKITSNAFFIRALALAAAQYPLTVGQLVALEGRRDGPGLEGVLPSNGGRDVRDTRTLANRGRQARDRAIEGPASEGSRPTEAIQIAEHVNVGFAVNSPQGLVVPIVHGAELRTLAEIARQEKLLTDQARSNKLTLGDLEGESIALSNLGAYDIDTFLGIVPPPVSTILTAGKVTPTAVPWDGRVVARKLVSLSLAVDRRIVDEAYAARFLQTLAQKLEGPERLV